jgi:hypothetical protein
VNTGEGSEVEDDAGRVTETHCRVLPGEGGWGVWGGMQRLDHSLAGAGEEFGLEERGLESESMMFLLGEPILGAAKRTGRNPLYNIKQKSRVSFKHLIFTHSVEL